MYIHREHSLAQKRDTSGMRQSVEINEDDVNGRLTHCMNTQGNMGL